MAANRAGVPPPAGTRQIPLPATARYAFPAASSRTPSDSVPAGIVASTDLVPSGVIFSSSFSGFSDR